MPNPLLPLPGGLRDLPSSVRLLLTAFLAIIGFGYLVAVVNIRERHALADGVPGLSLDDLRAVYSGLHISAAKRTEIPSRMLTMIRGEMRQYFSTDENFTILETWLKNGAKREDLDKGPPRKTPQRVIIGDCLRCHARSTGTAISKEAPFGADEFDVNYDLISTFAAGQVSTTQESAFVPPQYTLPRLILVSHQHMLTIPVFTLLVGAIFALTTLPAPLRHLLTPIPMLALVIDFAGWWLARWAEPFIYAIAAAGAVYGLAVAIQILTITWDLWAPPRPSSPANC